MSEDIERATKRTGEILATFGKNYLAAYTAQAIQGTVDKVVSDTLGAVQERAAELKGDKAEEKEKREPQDEEFVAVKISGRHEKYDVDSSKFTSYGVTAVLVRPSDSVIRNYETRYRALRKQNEDLRKALKKNEALKKFKFPPKKLFGNREEDFLNKRQDELNHYFEGLALDEELGASHEFRAQLGLEEDERREMERAVFVDAFNATCEGMGVNFADDPADFEDEGTGLTILMLDVVDKEVIPNLRDRIWQKTPPGAMRDTLYWKARSAVNQAVGKSVNKAWEEMREGFNASKKQVGDSVDKLQPVLEETVRKVVSKLAPKIVEKVASATKPPEQKEDPLEKLTVEPRLEKTEIGREVLKALAEDATSAEHIRRLQQELQARIRTRRRLESRMSDFAYEFRELPAVRYTIETIARVVLGVVDLWLLTAKALLEGVLPFFEARDHIEAAIASANGPEAVSAAVRKEADDLRKSLTGQLRKTSLNIAIMFDRERRRITSELRGLSKDASAGLRSNIEVVPQKMLDFLASLRRDLVQALSSEFAEPMAADKAVAKSRQIFTRLGAEVFDSVFFVDAWQSMTLAVFDAARITLVDELGKLIKEIVQGGMGEIQGLVPEQLASLVDVGALVDQVVDSILTTLATKALVSVRKRLEAHVFSDEPDKA